MCFYVVPFFCQIWQKRFGKRTGNTTKFPENQQKSRVLCPCFSFKFLRNWKPRKVLWADVLFWKFSLSPLISPILEKCTCRLIFPKYWNFCQIRPKILVRIENVQFSFPIGPLKKWRGCFKRHPYCHLLHFWDFNFVFICDLHVTPINLFPDTGCNKHFPKEYSFEFMLNEVLCQDTQKENTWFSHINDKDEKYLWSKQECCLLCILIFRQILHKKKYCQTYSTLCSSSKIQQTVLYKHI